MKKNWESEKLTLISGKAKLEMIFALKFLSNPRQTNLKKIEFNTQKKNMLNMIHISIGFIFYNLLGVQEVLSKFHGIPAI